MIQGRIVDAPTIKGTINATLLKGDKGDKGDTPQLSIGEVTTLEPNESATVEISDTVISFGIPRGVQGERGLQGIQGERGEQGFSITNVTDYYALSRSKDVNPASLVFSTNVPTMTALDRYLWTYTRFTLGDGSTVQTNRHIISVYGDKGDQGVGVSHVVAHYQVCESPINAPAKWDKDRTLTPQYKYLWSYETFTFTNGSTVNTTPRLIGVYGDRGIKGEKGDTPTITTSKSGGQTTIMSDGVPVGTINDGHTPNISIGTVSTLEPDQPATATITGTAENPVLNLGIPQGEDGHSPVITATKSNGTTTVKVDGVTVATINDGEDGHSPVISASKSGKITTITADGTVIATINDGQDGHSPVITTSKSGKTTTILSDGTSIGTVLDGEDGQDGTTPSFSIGTVQSGQTAAASITGTDANPVLNLTLPKGDDGQAGQGIPTGGTTGQVLKKTSATDYDAEWADESGAVTDVQINGSSVVSDGVAEIPIASGTDLGVVKVDNQSLGLYVNSNQKLSIAPAGESTIKASTDVYKPIVPLRQHIATFFGLAKASGDTTQSQSSNAVGVYTEEAKIAIQKMLGIYEAPWELIREDTFTNETVTSYEITVDGNGNAFELTDLILSLEIPDQEGDVSIEDYGRINFLSNNSIKIGVYPGATTTKNRKALAKVLQKNGLMEAKCTPYVSNNANQAENAHMQLISDNAGSPYKLSQTVPIDKIILTAVKGKINYKLLGKRKWN